MGIPMNIFDPGHFTWFVPVPWHAYFFEYKLSLQTMAEQNNEVPIHSNFRHIWSPNGVQNCFRPYFIWLSNGLAIQCYTHTARLNCKMVRKKSWKIGKRKQCKELHCAHCSRVCAIGKLRWHHNQWTTSYSGGLKAKRKLSRLFAQMEQSHVL